MQVGVTTNADDVAKAFSSLRAQYPKEFEKAFVSLRYKLRAESARAIRTGASAALRTDLHFPRLSGITMRLSPARTGFGGVLHRSIKAFTNGRRLVIGWPDRLRQYGEAFQSSQRRSFASQERKLLRARGISQARIDRGYDRPAREVWGPIINAPGTQQYMVEVMAKRLERANAKAERLARRRARAAARRERTFARLKTKAVRIGYTRGVKRYGRVLAKASKRIKRASIRSAKRTRKTVVRSIRNLGR